MLNTFEQARAPPAVNVAVCRRGYLRRMPLADTMPFELPSSLPPGIIEESTVLLAKLEAASTELAAIRCGLACDDFVQRVLDMNLMSADEADQFSNHIETSQAIKFRLLAEELRKP